MFLGASAESSLKCFNRVPEKDIKMGLNKFRMCLRSFQELFDVHSWDKFLNKHFWELLTKSYLGMVFTQAFTAYFVQAYLTSKH